MIDYDTILRDITDNIKPHLAAGRIADYIPQLSKVSREQFGIAVVTVDGAVHHAGDAVTPFSIQSISKVYTLTLAMQHFGESMWSRVGKEPSGNRFNSLVQLELENGIPRNPLINAGALVVVDMLLSATTTPREDLLDFVRKMSNNIKVNDDIEVAVSERTHGFRNAALANFMRDFGNIVHPVERVLGQYFHQCSLRMSCIDLARGFLFLVNGGLCPWTKDQILTREQARRVNALMLTCGTYDAAGDFAYRIGLPAKSGVGGGIVAIVPGKLAVAVWSPGLDEKGNSLAGMRALEQFVERTGLSIF